MCAERRGLFGLGRELVVTFIKVVEDWLFNFGEKYLRFVLDRGAVLCMNLKEVARVWHDPVLERVVIFDLEGCRYGYGHPWLVSNYLGGSQGEGS